LLTLSHQQANCSVSSIHIGHNQALGDLLGIAPSGVYSWNFDEAAAHNVHEYFQQHWTRGRCQVGFKNSRPMVAAGFSTIFEGSTLQPHDAAMQKLKTLDLKKSHFTSKDFAIPGWSVLENQARLAVNLLSGRKHELDRAHCVRESRETMSATGYGLDCNEGLHNYSVAVKLTADLDGESLSRMSVAGADEHDFSFGPKAGAGGIYGSNLYHCSLYAVSPTAPTALCTLSHVHTKLIFFYRVLLEREAPTFEEKAPEDVTTKAMPDETAPEPKRIECALENKPEPDGQIPDGCPVHTTPEMTAPEAPNVEMHDETTPKPDDVADSTAAPSVEPMPQNLDAPEPKRFKKAAIPANSDADAGDGAPPNGLMLNPTLEGVSEDDAYGSARNGG